MTDQTFECVVFEKQAFPDDIGLWPDMARTAAYAARDRLLEREPGLTVTADRAYCIDSGHDRWPDPLPKNLEINGFTHALIYEITLDRPVAE